MEPIAELVARLVAVDSVNPMLSADAPGEAELARVVAAWSEAAGLEVEVEEAAPGPSGGGAHEEVEWVDLASVERCAEVYRAVAEAFCA